MYPDVIAAACSAIIGICVTCLTPACVDPSQILLDTLYRSILRVANAIELCIDDITAGASFWGTLGTV